MEGGIKVGTAGHETVTITYTDPETGKASTFEHIITVNDKISAISIKTGIDANVKNKYGTAKSGLTLTGATIDVTTGSGKHFDVPINSSMLTGTYNPNTLDIQNIQVTYAGKTTTAGAGLDVQLKNYITGITATAPSNFEVAYGENPDYSNVTFTVNYANGTHSSAKNITSAEKLSTYTVRPVASKFNSSHKYAQTITLTYNTPEDADIDMLPRTDTFTVTTVDTVTGIAVTQRPTKKEYNYNETFNGTGGLIAPTYASGATGSDIGILTSNVRLSAEFASFPTLKPVANKFTNGKATVQIDVEYTDPTSGQVSNANFNITVNDVLQGLTVTSPKNTFDWGDTITVGTGTINAVWASGATSAVAESSVDFLDNGTSAEINMRPLENLFNSTTNTLTKNVKLSYNGVTADPYEITINNPIKEIKVDPSNKPKHEFQQNEANTNLGGKIIVLRKATTSDANGKKVDVQDSWVTGITTNTTTGSTARNATITYTAEGKTLTCTYPYTVKNGVQGIDFAEMPDLKLKYGVAFAATGKIKIKTSADPTGENNVVPIQTAWVKQADGSAVNTNITGTQNLLITYTDSEGNTFTKSYSVEVQDYVKSVKVTPSSLTGECGKTFEEIFKANNAKVTITMAKNNREFDLADGDASLTALINALNTNGYKNNVTTNQALTANYVDDITDSFTKGTGFPVNVSVKLNDVITAVEKEVDPNLVQNYGTAFDVGNGKVRVKTVANPIGSVESINPAWIKEENGSEYDQNSAPGIRNIKLVYPGFTGPEPTYSITTKTSVKDVVISPDPYTNGIKGMTLEKIFEDANFTYEITYNGTDHKQTGTLNKDWLKNTYNPQSTTQTLQFNIADNYEYSNSRNTNVTGEVTITLVSDSIQGVTIKTNPEAIQKYGTNFDVGSGQVEVTMASGEKVIEAINRSWIKEIAGENYDNTNVGTRNLKIVYPGYIGVSPTFEVTVKDYVKEVKVTPSILNGECGKTFEEIFTENNAKVTVVMAKDSQEFDLAGDDLTAMITALKNGGSGYKNNVTTTQTLSATYTDNVVDSYTKGETRPVSVNVKLTDAISKVEITKNPTVIQEYGKPLNLANGEITITKVAGGAEAPIPISSAWVTEMDGSQYNNTLTTERTLKVTYPGYTSSTPLTFNVDVRTVVESVTIKPTSVTAFIGDTIDDLFTNNTLTYEIKYKGSNDLKTGTLTKTMTTDSFVSSSAGTKTLNFTVPDNYERSMTNGQNAPLQGSLTVNVMSDSIANVTIGTNPTEDQKYGADFDVGAGTVQITMTSGGTPQTVPIEPEWIKETDGTDYNPNKLGEREVMIKYPGYDGAGVRVNINVKNYVTGITATPNSFTGNCGTAFETLVSGIKFKLTYADNSQKDLPDSEVASIIQSMKANYKPTSIARETITFDYTDTDTNNFLTNTPIPGQITVKLTDVVTGIVIKENPTVDQKYNMGYQVGAGEVTIKTANNPTGTDYPIQSAWIKELSGADYNSKLLGTRNVKIVHPDYPDINIGEVPVNVKDWVQSYDIKAPTNTEYHVGDTVEDRDGYIQPVMASGTKGNKIALNHSDIELTYNTSSAGQKTVEIKYKGTSIGDFKITVTDGIEYIKMKKMPKTEYLYGEALSTKTPDGTQEATIVIKKYSDSAEKEVSLKDCTLSGYNSKNITGAQTITVEYDGGTTNFTVTVKDFVKEIGVKAPTKKSYPVGSTITDLDLTGGEVWEIMASGATRNRVAMTKDMITSFDSTAVGTTQVEITYNGKNENFPVTIVDDVKSINVKSGPTKDEYNYGEELNLEGAMLEIEKDSGNEEVKITKDMVSGYNPKKLGEQELTVTYNGQKVGIITVTVNDYIKGIDINLPKKTYEKGEELDLTGATVKVMTASGKVDDEAPLTLAMIDASTQYDPEKIGSQTLKINYGTYTGSVKVTVKSPEVAKEFITLVKEPNKLQYRQGEELDLTGAMIKVQGQTGTKYVYATADMVSGYNADKLGEQTVTITYKDTKMTFKVTVIEREIPQAPIITLVKAPNKLTYKYGEALDVTGALIKVEDKNGTNYVGINTAMCDGYNANKPGVQTVTVTYNGVKMTFKVTVLDEEKPQAPVITLAQVPNKLTYKYGENLDLTGAKVKIEDSKNTIYIDVNESMCEGYDANKPGEQIITVNYDGTKMTFKVTVLEKEQPAKPVTPVKPETPTKPSRPSRPNVITRPSDIDNVPTIDPVVVEPPVEKEPEPEPAPIIKEEEKKPEVVLGVKDEKNTINYAKVGLYGSLAGIAILLLLAATKRNVQVFVEDGGEYKFGGATKVSRRRLMIDANKFLDGNTYNNSVKIILTEKIAERLNGYDLEIKHKDTIERVRVEYHNRPFEIILK